MNKFPTKIAIIGVGLIGGSIAMGLKKHFGAGITIYGSCNNIKRAIKAQKQSIIDKIITDFNSIDEDIDLIIIAASINVTLKILNKLDQKAFNNTVIMDVGSTKKFILNRIKNLTYLTNSFIGTHPMAGSELSGFENSSPNLFRNKHWIICNDKKTINSKQFKIVKKLIDILGANMILMDAKTHDNLTSWASHLSLVTSSILINTIAGNKNWNQIAKIASTGFRDTTRLASDNPRMKTDIIVTNRDHMLEALDKFKAELEIFSNLVRQSDEESILKYFRNTKHIRDLWLSNHFS